MMRDEDEVERLAAGILGTSSVTATHLPIGFGSENWRIAGPAGDYVLKIGPLDTAAKWASAHSAHALATSVGVPVAPLVHFSVRDTGVVRMYEWVAGTSPAAIAGDPAARARFLTELGAAVAALHSIDIDGFSSRLDGSAPVFASWDAYVEYRVEQIRERSRGSPALDAPTVEAACAAISELAHAVADVATPTLCHRDLHADNLVAGADGALVAIIDWDQSEAWDAAGDTFKLDFMLFSQLDGGVEIFRRAYERRMPRPPLWAERVRLVDLLETLNTLANTTGESVDADWDAQLQARLHTLLA
jgi:aminoglycoside phosphotransferase (APT) family kinase protein